MDFTSLGFIIFLTITLIIFYLVPKRGRLGVLLAASVLFFISNEWKMLIVALATAMWTYYAGQKIEHAEGAKKKAWLWYGIVPVLLALFIFKYFNFFSETSARLLRWFSFSANPVVLELFAAVGISYYTFKVISYMIEIYRGNLKPETHIANYTLYVIFFPQMTAGPIARPNQFLPQLGTSLVFSKEKFVKGLELILLGFFKKLVIVNRISSYVDLIYTNPAVNSGLSLFLAAFFYSVQIYCDFSGYSDLAIGIGYLFGIETEKNFDAPYLAKNIKEFWSRWHISLSSWLRDYIYIPLGGSRVKKGRHILNMMITFFVSGLWHGANWTFLVWGGLHGVLNLLCKKKKKDMEESAGGVKAAIAAVIKTAVTFTAVSIAWIFFRMDTLENAFITIKLILTNTSFSLASIQASILLWTYDNMCVAYFLTACTFIFSLYVKEWREYYRPEKGTKSQKIAWNIFLLASILLFGLFGRESSFIYANF